MNHEKILESSQGLFGHITLCDTANSAVRLMKINDEIEGQVFSFPSATSFSCSMDGPGAVSASRYIYAFIIPAWHFSNKKGLMLGLGAGIGATMLLTLFPTLSLTVVEIDSEVIRFAREYFPLVSFYENQGRLQIIASAAETYLDHSQDTFAFVLLDLFSGDEGNHNNLPLINKALKIAPYFMANIISSEVLLPEIHQEWMWLRASPVMAAEKTNWMMTNINAISREMLDYNLFSNFAANENVMTANRYFRYILSQIEAACFYR